MSTFEIVWLSACTAIVVTHFVSLLMRTRT